MLLVTSFLLLHYMTLDYTINEGGVVVVCSSGVEHGNLRELALARMKDLGTECRDVRTREVGIQEIHHKVRPYEVSSEFIYS